MVNGISDKLFKMDSLTYFPVCFYLESAWGKYYKCWLFFSALSSNYFPYNFNDHWEILIF